MFCAGLPPAAGTQVIIHSSVFRTQAELVSEQ